MQIRIEGSDLPGSSCGPSPERPGGHHNIHVAVPRRGKPDDLLGLVGGDAPSATWTLDCEVTNTAEGVDVKGPYIQGPRGGRFIYLSWGTVDADGTFTMFRRGKIMLHTIPPAVIDKAIKSGVLVARLGLTDARGNPSCAALRPVEWSAARS